MLGSNPGAVGCWPFCRCRSYVADTLASITDHSEHEVPMIFIIRTDGTGSRVLVVCVREKREASRGRCCSDLEASRLHNAGRESPLLEHPLACALVHQASPLPQVFPPPPTATTSSSITTSSTSTGTGSGSVVSLRPPSISSSKQLVMLQLVWCSCAASVVLLVLVLRCLWSVRTCRPQMAAPFFVYVDYVLIVYRLLIPGIRLLYVRTW